jgi:MFS transporter, FHS family, glucose/mannose:H+ symporter
MAFMLKVRGWWLTCAGFFVNGMGVVLLGPLLPRLETLWGLGDGEGGALLASLFLGMSAGTVLVLQRRRKAMATGAVCCWLGLTAVAGLVGVSWGAARMEALACAALLVYGFGLGQAITTLNLGAGLAAEGRSARISFGNAMWSTGAIVSPILMAVALRGASLQGWLLGVALVFPAVWLWIGGGRTVARAEDRRPGTTTALVMVFAGLMFLYGSAEACFSGWVTTFARRAGGAGMDVSPLSTSAFWFGVAGGRAIAGVLLRGWRDRPALLVLVGGAAVGGLGLVFGRSMGSISLWAALCGMMLGPTFAVVLGATLNAGASSRQTGTVLAMCGAGATTMPFVLGVVSQRTSLTEALVLPGGCLVGMFLIVIGLVRGGRAGVGALVREG